MARLVNLNEYRGSKENVIYIGRFNPRWGSSIFQNKYKVGKDGTREEVIEKYRNDLYANPVLVAKLLELKAKLEQGMVLGCWCYPEPCHGDVLLEAMGLTREGK